ncbi:hypothetical protein FACS1894208_10180 [Clostridia bacterium]|nr:hypothetical protein FACS1894208_10180 [Clostridia bacterium]
MRKLRLVFAKTGRARWLSHLDVMRVLQRGLTRLGAPVAYSQGFNPHMKMSIALPCPVGVESVCEICDVTFDSDTYKPPIAELILPEGFSVMRVILPIVPAKDIKWIDYDVELTYTDKPSELLRVRLSAQNPTEKPASVAERHEADAYRARRVGLFLEGGEPIL